MKQFILLLILNIFVCWPTFACDFGWVWVSVSSAWLFENSGGIWTVHTRHGHCYGTEGEQARVPQHQLQPPWAASSYLQPRPSALLPHPQVPNVLFLTLLTLRDHLSFFSDPRAVFLGNNDSNFYWIMKLIHQKLFKFATLSRSNWIGSTETMQYPLYMKSSDEIFRLDKQSSYVIMQCHMIFKSFWWVTCL